MQSTSPKAGSLTRKNYRCLRANSKRSRLKKCAYIRDGVNNEWAQPDFDYVMKALSKRFGAGNLTLASHSMGNRLILRNLTAQQFAWSQGVSPCSARYGAIAMMSPDMDYDVLKNYDRCNRARTI